MKVHIVNACKVEPEQFEQINDKLQSSFNVNFLILLCFIRCFCLQV